MRLIQILAIAALAATATSSSSPELQLPVAGASFVHAALKARDESIQGDLLHAHMPSSKDPHGERKKVSKVSKSKAGKPAHVAAEKTQKVKHTASGAADKVKAEADNAATHVLRAANHAAPNGIKAADKAGDAIHKAKGHSEGARDAVASAAEDMHTKARGRSLLEVLGGLLPELRVGSLLSGLRPSGASSGLLEGFLHRNAAPPADTDGDDESEGDRQTGYTYAGRLAGLGEQLRGGEREEDVGRGDDEEDGRRGGERDDSRDEDDRQATRENRRERGRDQDSDRDGSDRRLASEGGHGVAAVQRVAEEAVEGAGRQLKGVLNAVKFKGLRKAGKGGVKGVQKSMKKAMRRVKKITPGRLF